jgi:hypothetical protein
MREAAHAKRPLARDQQPRRHAQPPDQFDGSHKRLIKVAAMKIHIELEVAPDEVPLAAELLAVLR